MYFYKRQELLFLLLMNAWEICVNEKTLSALVTNCLKRQFYSFVWFQNPRNWQDLHGHFVCTPLLFFFVQNYLFFKIKRRVHIFIFFDKVVSFLFECLSQWLQYYNPHINAADVFKSWGSLAKSLMNTEQHELKGRHL